MKVWTTERLYALAFGTALGLSASQIAASMGDVTRNAIIGKWARTRSIVHSPDLRPEAWKRRRKAAAMKRKPIIRINMWTKEEDAILRKCAAKRMTSREIAKRLPGRTIPAILARRKTLDVVTYSIKRFTPEDDEIIRSDFAASVPIEETAVKLGRSYGVLRQRIFYLGLRRDGRKTKLAKKFGMDVLQISDDPNEIVRVMAERQAAQKAAVKAERAAKSKAAIEALEKALAEGTDRKTAYQAAMLGGATLQQVGDHQGITRERVRQIVSDQRSQLAEKEAECRTCGEPFKRNVGIQKYCSELCRPSTYHPRQEEETVECEGCGNAFVRKHRSKKYCSILCRNKAQNDRRSKGILAKNKPTDINDILKGMSPQELMAVMQRAGILVQDETAQLEMPKPVSVPKKPYSLRRLLK